MKVQVGPTLYHVSFRTKSERIAHDEMPAELRAALHQAGVLTTAIIPPKNRLQDKLSPVAKRYLKLKPPTRISTATTTCSIATVDGEITTGFAYFSKSELDGFNRRKANRKALGRALREFPNDFRVRFQAAYDLAYEARLTKAAQVRDASPARAAVSSGYGTIPPVPAQQEGGRM